MAMSTQRLQKLKNVSQLYVMQMQYVFIIHVYLVHCTGHMAGHRFSRRGCVDALARRGNGSGRASA
jgi:hypothetical protein